MKQMSFKLDFGYELPLPRDLIADPQWPWAKESAKLSQGREPVEWLQRSMLVTTDQLRESLVTQTDVANRSWAAINAVITPSRKLSLDTNELPITYANVNSTRYNLVHS